jgi:3-deoxy-D-manno-octulosonate 8-phosphate phosphatase (KDO 8-P phosphatase)
VGDKPAALREICAEYGVTLQEVLYIGDDLNDYTAFEIAGVAVAVGDACEELKRIAHYVTIAPGGKGAVREVVDLLLKAGGYDPVALWKTKSDRPVGKQ